MAKRLPQRVIARYFLKPALVLVRLDHVARFIVNANHSIMRSAVLAGVADCIAGSVRSVIPEPTEWQHNTSVHTVAKSDVPQPIPRR